MRLFKYMTLFAAAALFASCETNLDTLQISSSDDFVAPVIGPCSDIAVTADNAKKENATFTWTAADFGLPVEITYSVYLSYGEKTALLGQAKTIKASFSYEDVNSVVLTDLGIEANTTANVTAYVTAKMAGTDAYEAVLSAQSNSFTVTAYAATVKAMYVVGNLNGWGVGSAVEIWETTGGSGIYEGIYNFVNPDNAKSSFQILPTLGIWDGQLGYDAFTAHSATITKDDRNMALPVGFWKISLNPAAKSIEATAVKSVGILGTVNGWKDKEGDDLPLTYNVATNVWESAPLAFEANGEFLVRLNYSWDNKYGASGKNSTAISGGLELTAGGGSNIKVAQAGTYVVKFHADRTPCVVEVVAAHP